MTNSAGYFCALELHSLLQIVTMKLEGFLSEQGVTVDRTMHVRAKTHGDILVAAAAKIKADGARRPPADVLAMLKQRPE